MNRYKKSGERNVGKTRSKFEVNSAAPGQKQGHGVKGLWADFVARYRRNEMTIVDKVLAAVFLSAMLGILLFIVFPIMIKLMVWIVTTPRDIAAEWMERAHDCERRNISLIVAVASTSCVLWLLYILYLTQKHASDVLGHIIEKMEAQRELEVTLEKFQNLIEVSQILRERDAERKVEVEKLKKVQKEMEATTGFRISNGIGRIVSLMTGVYEGIQSLFKSTSEMKAASVCEEAK